MAVLKYFTDKNIAKAVTDQLRKRGVNVLRCEDVGMDKASDHDLLAFATQENCAVVSFDADFLRRHNEWQQSGRPHAGIFHLASQYRVRKTLVDW